MYLRKMSCEEKSNILLVREVEKYPVLYNSKMADYSKRDLVEAAWNHIAEVMNDDASNCKEKWRNLRTVFVRKMKPPPAGTVRRKTYYLNDAMAFLTPFIKLQKSDYYPVECATISSLASESENAALSEELDQNEFSEPEADDDDNEKAMQPESSKNLVYNQYSSNELKTSVQSRRKPIKRSEFTEEFSEYVEQKRSRYSDESRKYFLLSLLPDVQNLTDNQMKFFRRKMLDALEEAEACPAYNRPPECLYNEDTNQMNSVAYFQQFSPKKEF